MARLGQEPVGQAARWDSARPGMAGQDRAGRNTTEAYQHHERIYVYIYIRVKIKKIIT